MKKTAKKQSLQLLSLILTLSLSVSHIALAKSDTSLKTFTFTYKPKSEKLFKLNLKAESFEQAFKLASKQCYQTLTKGVYPGEEKGLDYIDVCANPKS